MDDETRIFAGDDVAAGGLRGRDGVERGEEDRVARDKEDAVAKRFVDGVGGEFFEGTEVTRVDDGVVSRPDCRRGDGVACILVAMPLADDAKDVLRCADAALMLPGAVRGSGFGARLPQRPRGPTMRARTLSRSVSATRSKPQRIFFALFAGGAPMAVGGMVVTGSVIVVVVVTVGPLLK